MTNSTVRLYATPAALIASPIVISFVICCPWTVLLLTLGCAFVAGCYFAGMWGVTRLPAILELFDPATCPARRLEACRRQLDMIRAGIAEIRAALTPVYPMAVPVPVAVPLLGAEHLVCPSWDTDSARAVRMAAVEAWEAEYAGEDERKAVAALVAAAEARRGEVRRQNREFARNLQSDLIGANGEVVVPAYECETDTDTDTDLCRMDDDRFGCAIVSVPTVITPAAPTAARKGRNRKAATMMATAACGPVPAAPAKARKARKTAKVITHDAARYVPCGGAGYRDATPEDVGVVLYVRTQSGAFYRQDDPRLKYFA